MKKLSREQWVAVSVALVVVFGFLFFGRLVFQSSAASAVPAETADMPNDVGGEY